MADYTTPPWSQLVAGKPWTDEKAAAAFENPIAIAEGADGAPKVQGVALGGVSLGAVAFSASSWGIITDLDRAELIVGQVYAFTPSGSGALLIRFSNNNGASYGASQALWESGPTGSISATVRVNMRTGAYSAIGSSSDGAIIQGGTLTVPDGANAIGISTGTGSAGAAWAADFYCLGGRP